VKERYRQYEVTTGKKVVLTQARLKMTILPKGSKPLPNPVGTALGSSTNGREVEDSGISWNAKGDELHFSTTALALSFEK
jgi:hypothetical protein